MLENNKPVFIAPTAVLFIILSLLQIAVQVAIGVS